MGGYKAEALRTACAPREGGYRCAPNSGSSQPVRRVRVPAGSPPDAQGTRLLFIDYYSMAAACDALRVALRCALAGCVVVGGGIGV